MSIARITCGPADVIVGGFVWKTSQSTGQTIFDPERVEGAFQMAVGDILSIPHSAPSGTEMWYHFRHAQTSNSINFDGTFLTIQDGNSVDVARMGYSDGSVFVSAVGDTTSSTGAQQLALNTAYSMDIQVIVAATITCRWYINGALYGEVTVGNSVGGKGVPRSVTWSPTNTLLTTSATYASEIVIADEDTRGMRVREMRPKAFGIFQEWDGSINALRDTDLATGISTDTALRRVSFGVSNIENVQPGDVINRVVAQTYAQKGETGLGTFNHFFRFKNGDLADGANQTLTNLGQFFIEEFALNPNTSLAWQPADFGSLQTGVRSNT